MTYRKVQNRRVTERLSIRTRSRLVFTDLVLDWRYQTVSLIESDVSKGADLNQLHSFPEGNGRTQRLFLEQVAEKAGHRVDLSIGTEHRIIEASIAQTKGQHGTMERFIAEAADPDRVRAMRAALDHLNQVWGKDNTSRTYIAATVPSQDYTGALYGKPLGTSFCAPTIASWS